MNIRDRILRLAIDAESAGKQDAANVLYLLGGLMEPDGSHCRLGEFARKVIGDSRDNIKGWCYECRDSVTVEYGDPGRFMVNPDVLGAIAFGVNLSMKLPPVSAIPAEEYALTWPILED